MIINGPNLNLTGKREPPVYGTAGFPEYLEKLKIKYSQLTLDYFQSNHEGEIIDKLQESGSKYNGIILNSGALTHTSLAIGDTVAAIECPVIEVHLSNIYSREKIRHRSFIAPHCRGVIAGMGLKGYEFAIQALFNG